MTTIAELEAPIEFPDWVPAAQLVRPLLHSAITEQLCTPRGAAIRRDRTRESPLHFALVYLMDYFRDQRTGVVSFAEGHLDMFSRVGDWADRQGCHCFACVAARIFGKSTILTGCAAPTWALCHEHHTFYALFSNTVDLAVANHLRRLVDVFSDSNPASRLLLYDYPHMAPLKGGGPKRTVFKGGATIAAGGVMDKTLGMVERNERPTLIGADDMLPGAAMTTPENIDKVKTRLTQDVWPMNDRADKFVTGTMFARGDLADDIVRIATEKRPRSDDRGRWLTSRGFDCLYYRPVWPQKGWPTAAMTELRELSPVDYALQYEPDLLDDVEQDTYFTDELFEARRWAAPYIPLVPPQVGRIFITDHAVNGTAKRGDRTALAVMAFDGQRMFLEHSEADHYSMDQLAARIWSLQEALLAQGKTPATVLGWERNNGGVALSSTFAKAFGLPEGMKLIEFWSGANKAARIKDFFAQVVAYRVLVPRELPGFEARAVAWKPGATGPGVDDELDTASAGSRFFRFGKFDDDFLRRPGKG